MKKTLTRVTRQDVADKAGVTPTIVSYVVNNNRYVDASKKKRVTDAMKELGYRPNVMARALKGKHSHLILFIVDDLLSEHFGKINKKMNEWANKNDYFICLCESRNDDEFIYQIFQSYFDGVIIGSNTFSPSYIQSVIDTKIPVVLLEMKKYNDLVGNFALINSGLYQGARDCCKALLDKGRKHIVYIDSYSSYNQKDFTSDDFRYQGFVDELKTHNRFNDSHFQLISQCLNEKDVNTKIEKLIKRGFIIDGVFGRTDSVAVQAMFKMQSLGYSIPEDCSVIGVDNSRIGNYTSPKLTTLDIDREGIGEAAITMLSRLFKNKQIDNKNISIRLRASIIYRESL